MVKITLSISIIDITLPLSKWATITIFILKVFTTITILIFVIKENLCYKSFEQTNVILQYISHFLLLKNNV